MRLPTADRCLLLLAFLTSSMAAESPAETNPAARPAPLVNRAALGERQWRQELLVVK